MPLSYVEALVWGKLFLKHNPQFDFPFRQVFVNEILLRIVQKTNEKYVSSTFESCNFCTMSFDL